MRDHVKVISDEVISKEKKRLDKIYSILEEIEERVNELKTLGVDLKM